MIKPASIFTFLLLISCSTSSRPVTMERGASTVTDVYIVRIYLGQYIGVKNDAEMFPYLNDELRKLIHKKAIRINSTTPIYSITPTKYGFLLERYSLSNEDQKNLNVFDKLAKQFVSDETSIHIP